MRMDQRAVRSRSASRRQTDHDIGRSIHQRAQEARADTLRAAVAGDADAISYLRTEAAWFTGSQTNPQYDPNQRKTDAEIIEAARAHLRFIGGADPKKLSAAEEREIEKRCYAAAEARKHGTTAASAPAHEHGWQRAMAKANPKSFGQQPSESLIAGWAKAVSR